MKTFVVLLMAWFAITPAQAQSWTKKLRIPVVPGHSIGEIVLGKPVPASASKLYGNPVEPVEPIPGSEGVDTGSLVFGSTAGFEIKNGFLVKLNDGRGDKNVVTVYARGVRAYTKEGATMGMDLAKVRTIYPGAKLGTDDLTGHPKLTIPGLDLIFGSDRKLVEMVLRK